MSRNGGTASVGREPLWDETAVGEMKEDAPVDAKRLMERVLERGNLLGALRQVRENGGSPGSLDYRGSLTMPSPHESICRTAVYVTRSYGGVGGGSREASPYPE